MKKRLSVAAVIITAAFGLSACSDGLPSGGGGDAHASGALTQAQVIDEAPVAESVPSSPVLDEIKETGTLKWGGNASRPLFSQLNPTTDTYEGFEAGLAYMFAKYVTGEADISFTGVTVVNREALLQNGTVQFISDSYTITPERAELVNFAGPYLQSGVMVGIPVSDDASKTADDLNGMDVGTLSGLAENALLDAAPDAHPVVFSSSGEVVQGMLQGHTAAIAFDQPSLLGAISKNPEEIKLLQTDTIADLNFGIGLSKGDPVLKDFVNDWLVEISESGLYGKLWDATVGDIVPTPELPEIGSVPGS